jgi:hypothetical protein
VTTEEEALGVKCPKCGALRTKPCVYLQPKFRYDREPYRPGARRGWRTAKTLVADIGDPTKRVHNERRTRADQKATRARRRAYTKKMATPPAGLASLRAFDVAEYNQTREWLRRYGAILWQPPVPPRPAPVHATGWLNGRLIHDGPAYEDDGWNMQGLT